jgi:hypothetical protein
MIHEVWKRIRTCWNRTDSLVLCVHIAAFAAFIGNCWWESAAAASAASLAVLLILLPRASKDRTLRDAIVFGGIVAGLWPFGEWAVVHGLGWWGAYTAPGTKILDTPLYCAFVGWTASTYCYYVGRRTAEMQFPAAASAAMSGLSALAIGAIGENLFVAARLWMYHPSSWDWWHVPAFVPLAYGLSYATLPALRRFRLLPASVLFTLITLAVSVGLGIAAGFFPRPG